MERTREDFGEEKERGSKRAGKKKSGAVKEREKTI